MKMGVWRVILTTFHLCTYNIIYYMYFRYSFIDIIHKKYFERSFKHLVIIYFFLKLYKIKNKLIYINLNTFLKSYYKIILYVFMLISWQYSCNGKLIFCKTLSLRKCFMDYYNLQKFIIVEVKSCKIVFCACYNNMSFVFLYKELKYIHITIQEYCIINMM